MGVPKVNILTVGIPTSQYFDFWDPTQSQNIDSYSKNDKDVLRSISSDLDSRFTFSNFIVGKPNELAFAAARRVSEAKDVPFNPLFPRSR